MGAEGSLERGAALDHLWDRVSCGQDGGTELRDSADLAAIRAIHANTQRPEPSPAFARRLREDLMHAAPLDAISDDLMRPGLHGRRGGSPHLSGDAGFGPEVKRRIMLGTYALSAGYYDAYYGQAQRVRTLIRRDFAEAFERFDALLLPTAPTTTFPLGARLDDPLSMYANDVFTLPVNLSGLPGLSIPNGLSDGLPTGLQIVGPAFSENRLLAIGHALEGALGFDVVPPRVREAA